MKEEIDIHKAAGILIKDRKLLVSRSQGKDFFVAPGGKLEEGELPKEALVRELGEEFQITIAEKDLLEFGIFYAQAAGLEDKMLQMDVYIVEKWEGEIVPNSEIEEIQWITMFTAQDIKLGSIFLHEVVPRLKAKGLID